MSLLDRLIRGLRPERMEGFPETTPPSPPLPPDPDLAPRVSAFRHQIESWVREARVGVPLLVLPAAPAPTIGLCISCGVAIPEDGWRCALCLEAVHQALRTDEEGTP